MKSDKFMKTISILGCGWLGLPLALTLLKDGYHVKGSTTDGEKLQHLKESGIEPYLISADPDFEYEPVKDFFNTDILVINIPPPRKQDVISYHSQQIGCIAVAARNSGTGNVIFVSSTSVYPNINKKVTEDDDLEPDKESGRALKGVEKLLTETTDFNTTVIRFSGLIGYDRNPRYFLKRRGPRAKANAPVNLIHRDDCIGIIKTIIENDIWGEVLNGSCDVNPMRREFYESEAELAGVDLKGHFTEHKTNYKIVSNEKLKKVTGYRFIFPDPLNTDR